MGSVLNEIGFWIYIFQMKTWVRIQYQMKTWENKLNREFIFSLVQYFSEKYLQ